MDDNSNACFSVEEQVNEIFEEYINPGLASHGGHAALSRLELLGDSWVVYIKFFGGCVGCPSSTAGTLKMIEMCLRDEMSAPGLVVKNVEQQYL
jgi:Fe-S cluster biogenesis protein NfuA